MDCLVDSCGPLSNTFLVRGNDIIEEKQSKNLDSGFDTMVMDLPVTISIDFIDRGLLWTFGMIDIKIRNI